MRISVEIPDYNITNCYNCPFVSFRGILCTPEKELLNFRCKLLSGFNNHDYPNKVQSAKPVRPKFCPIKRITKSKEQ